MQLDVNLGIIANAPSCLGLEDVSGSHRLVLAVAVDKLAQAHFYDHQIGAFAEGRFHALQLLPQYGPLLGAELVDAFLVQQLHRCQQTHQQILVGAVEPIQILDGLGRLFVEQVIQGLYQRVFLFRWLRGLRPGARAAVADGPRKRRLARGRQRRKDERLQHRLGANFFGHVLAWPQILFLAIGQTRAFFGILDRRQRVDRPGRRAKV